MLKKNTASQNLTFCLVNASTGAALTGATVTARRSIDGGAQASAGGSVTELGNGQYNFAPSQADTNGDLIGYLFTATSAIPVNLAVRTTAADLSDSVRLGLTALPNAAAEAAGGLYTRGTGAGQLSQSANGELGVATLAKTLTTYTGDTPQTGDAFARLGANGAGLTALGDARIGNLDAAVTSRMATYTQPTGFLAASFPTDPADQSLVIAATDAILTAVNTKASQTSVDDLPTNSELTAALAAADDAVLAAVAALSIPTADQNAAALLDLANAVEAGITVRKALRAMAAVLAGDATGAGTGAEAYKAIGNSGTTRVTPNADEDGNRTAVTLNL